MKHTYQTFRWQASEARLVFQQNIEKPKAASEKPAEAKPDFHAQLADLRKDVEAHRELIKPDDRKEDAIVKSSWMRVWNQKNTIDAKIRTAENPQVKQVWEKAEQEVQSVIEESDVLSSLENLTLLQEEVEKNPPKFVEENPSGTPPANTPTGKVDQFMKKNGLDKMVEKVSKWGTWLGEMWQGITNYFKPILANFIGMPWFKTLIGQENVEAIQKSLGMNPDLEKLRKEIEDRLPGNVKLIPDVNDPQADERAMVAFNDAYDQLPNKPARRELFFQLLKEPLGIQQPSSEVKELKLGKIAKVATEYSDAERKKPLVPQPPKPPVTSS